MFLFATLAEATQYLNFREFMGEHSEIAFSVFGLPIRWYALAYLAGIFLGYGYLLKLIAQPGAPMARRHADDMIFYAMLGIILGGRLGYVLFYNFEVYSQKPLDIFRLWDGGMSLHGGVIGVLIAIWYVTRQEKLSFLRFCDYIACVVPIGLFLGRLANFVNGELWGRVAYVPWAIVLPNGGPEPRHPSQLYEAGLEGVLLFAVLWYFFWRTRACYEPGKLVGIFVLGYGLCRFFVEFFREPDAQFEHTVFATFHMGQLLCLPMIAGGAWLIATAKRRAERVRPVPAETTA